MLPGSVVTYLVLARETGREPATSKSTASCSTVERSIIVYLEINIALLLDV